MPFMCSIFLIPSHPGALHWTHPSVSVPFIGKAFAKPQWFPIKPCLQGVPVPWDSSPVSHILTDAPQFVGIHNLGVHFVLSCPALTKAIPSVSPHITVWIVCVTLRHCASWSILCLPSCPHLQLSLTCWGTRQLWGTVPKAFPGYPPAPSAHLTSSQESLHVQVGWAICIFLFLSCGYCFTSTRKSGGMYGLQSWKEINQSSQMLCRLS